MKKNGICACVCSTPEIAYVSLRYGITLRYAVTLGFWPSYVTELRYDIFVTLRITVFFSVT